VPVADIYGTQLCSCACRDRDFTYPPSALLLDLHLMRSAAFLPSRLCTAEPRNAFICRQLPASRCLSLYQPAGPLVVRDALLLGEISRRYHHREGRIGGESILYFSLADAIAAMGYRTAGGYQRQLARDSLRRLVATTLRWNERTDEGRIRELNWHLLEDSSAAWEQDGYGRATVTISEVTVQLIEDGFLGYLDGARCRRLVIADETAARLWLTLECERLGPKPFYYRIFRPAPNTAPQESNELFISEIVGLDRWRNRRRVAHRLKKAIEVIETIDGGRYELRLEHGRDPATYNLRVRRSRRAKGAWRDGR